MSATATDIHQAVCTEMGGCLDACLETIRHCVDQLSDEQLWWRPHPSMNSIGNLLLHLNGNVRQWLVTGLSELEDDRNRPAEFDERGPVDRELMLEQLDETVAQAKNTLAQTAPEEMLSLRRIQGFDINGWRAVFDSVPHFKGHTQEIICLTRTQLGDDYQFRWQPTTPEEGAP